VRRSGLKQRAATAGPLSGRLGAALLAVGACVLSAGAGAPPALAITHAAATRIALGALHPQREPGPVVVFSLPRPVRRGGLVYEAGPPPVPGVRPLASAAYVYWEDLAHGAFFAHASRLVLVDARSGRVVRREDMDWFLIVNNRLAPFLITAQGYEGRAYVVYDAISARGHRRLHARAARYAGNGHPPRRTALLAHDCLIPIGDFRDPLFRGGGKAMLTFASRIGMKTVLPDVDTAKSLAGAVDKATAAGCNDVFIYLAGHGIPPNAASFAAEGAHVYHDLAHAVTVDAQHPGGPAAVMTSPGFVLRNGKLVDESSYVTPNDLIAIAKAHENAEFKIKIDSCFADRFAPVFDDTDNVRVLETSSSFDEVSAGAYVKGETYFTLDPKTHEVNGEAVNHIDDPDGAGGFTNGNLHGLYDWATFSSPTEDLVVGLAEAYGLGMPFNQSVKLGYTTPHLRTRPARTTPISFLGTIDAMGNWSFFDPTEVKLNATFSPQSGAGQPRSLAIKADTGTPLDAVEVVIPPAGSSPRQIVNSLCPTQLPTAAVSTTVNPSDTLTCSGGSLPIGQQFTLNVQTSPAPTPGMGGQLFGRQDGAFKGPFAITGP
jgi:hypothetical protein